MKPMFKIFVFLFLIIPFTFYSQAPLVDVATAQKKLEAIQIKGKGAFKVIDEKAQKLENGDVITTSLCFCDSMPGASSPSYNYFSRRYGLTTKGGKKLDPLYDNITFWEKDRYLVKYYDYNFEETYGAENWYALIDKDLKVLQVYQEEGIGFSSLYRVKKNGKYGAIDGSLSERLPFVYDSLSELSLLEEVNIMVKERSFYTYAAKGNGKWGLITTESDTIVPFKYDFLGNSLSGKMIAKSNGKWGMINQEDIAIVPFAYDSVFGGSGYFLVKAKKIAILPSDFNYKNAIFQYDAVALNPARGGDMGKIGSKWYFLEDKKISETDIAYDGFHYDKDSGPFVCIKKGELFGIYNTSRKKWESEFVYSKIVDILYEREWEDHTNYPVYHFIVIQDGKEVEFRIRD